jgi:hypothetical protein
LHARVWSTPAQGGARGPTGFRPDASTCALAGSYDFSVSYAVGKVQLQPLQLKCDDDVKLHRLLIGMTPEGVTP